MVSQICFMISNAKSKKAYVIELNEKSVFISLIYSLKAD